LRSSTGAAPRAEACDVHILFAHNDYGRYSGEEEAVERIAGLLQAAGHRISWMRRSSAGIGDSLGRKAQAFASGIWSVEAYREMRRRLVEDRPDVVQAQNLYPFLSSSILKACREAGVPVVMRVPNYRLFCPTGLHLRDGRVCEDCLGPGREWHCVRHNCEGSLAKSAGYAARNAFNRRSGTIVRNVDCFIVLSEFQRQRFEWLGIPSDRLAVVPNIAPVEEIRATPLPEDGYVAFVGRVAEEKGVRELLRAAEMLPSVNFAVAGSLDEPTDLVGSAPRNVEFVGFLSGQRLQDFYRRSRIVVCPSKWFEGFPNVIATAMAHGRPVVASAIGAIPEIVRNGYTGRLCRPGDCHDLCEALRSILDDRTMAQDFARAGRRVAETAYSPSVVLEALSSAFSKVRR
jgi:glycosyltransferase involved in cell wall biosynthesis